MIRTFLVFALFIVVLGCGDTTNPMNVMIDAVERNPDAEEVIDCLDEIPDVDTYESLDKVIVRLKFNKSCLDDIDIDQEYDE